TPDVPLLAMTPARRAYMGRDLDDWANHWGVPFRFPDHFPLRTVLPLRVAIAEPAATAAIYQAAWGENLAIDQPEILAQVLTQAGFDAQKLLEQATSKPVKDQLRANTERARAAGACGVPTMVVERPGRPPEMLWGQDRLELVAAYLGGSDFGSVAAVESPLAST
ncbi:MAG: 2-hydroxychromene-2-carboxylate isomerase, partial [Nannocystaceae bacterium]